LHEIKAERKQSAKYEHKDSINVKQKNAGKNAVYSRTKASRYT